jgi:hypothetical protein
MSPAVIVIIIIVVVVLAAMGLVLAQRQRKSGQLKHQFGPEYDRTVQDRGDRRAAEQDLAGRQEHREKLRLRDLDAVERQQYESSWRQVQTRFVDDPSGALGDAHRLVQQVMGARGYPTDDFDRQADVISVDHPELVADYRAAARLTRDNDRDGARTEDMREAMVHYRALFARLLDTHGSNEKEAP